MMKNIGVIINMEEEYTVKIEKVRYPKRPYISFPGWMEEPAMSPHDRFFISPTGMQVIISEARYEGNWWRHVSCSRDKGMTLCSWEELEEIKNLFIGVNEIAYQIFPPEDEYVHGPLPNISSGVLHLWHPIGFRPIPDFRIEGMI